MNNGDVFCILATGSRHHEDAGLIGESLYEVIAGTGARNIVIRHGACPGGADQIFQEFCESEAAWFDREGRSLIVDPVPADWDFCGPDCPPRRHRVRKKPGDVFHPGVLDDYCPGAGPRRNLAMVEKLPRPDVAVGFPLGRSSGTENCLRAAKAAGIPVRRFTTRARRGGDAA
ncbi:hypothetical protein [Actinomadura decatromicini]|uniref:DUF2493 domain-containing protein n=1 Tax=Actinomadura decatromicini TaxID=2604572 RepID=A0A5D3FAU2_9ACTN|nr:hypothetical protein [Actinomadura decatromicini]TYK45192.1 hypothetical protein FXF68_31435 [Actinomadura decatromicini]